MNLRAKRNVRRPHNPHAEAGAVLFQRDPVIQKAFTQHFLWAWWHPELLGPRSPQLPWPQAPLRRTAGCWTQVMKPEFYQLCRWTNGAGLPRDLPLCVLSNQKMKNRKTVGDRAYPLVIMWESAVRITKISCFCHSLVLSGYTALLTKNIPRLTQMSVQGNWLPSRRPEKGTRKQNLSLKVRHCQLKMQV